MNVVDGNKIWLYVDGDPVLYALSNEESLQNDLRETTNKYTGGKATFLGGKVSSMGSAEGLFAERIKNLLRQSENMELPAWQKIGLTVTGNSSFGPAGRKNGNLISMYSSGDLLIEELSGSEYNSIASTYIFSIWLKGVAGETVTIFLQDGPTASETNVVLTTSLVRYSVTRTTAGDGSMVYAGILHNANTATTFTASQPQMELGSSFTDYEPSQKKYEALLSAADTGQLISIQTGSIEAGSVLYTGMAIIRNIKRNSPDNQNVTYSFEYQISGQLTPVSIT